MTPKGQHHAAGVERARSRLGHAHSVLTMLCLCYKDMQAPELSALDHVIAGLSNIGLKLNAPGGMTDTPGMWYCVPGVEGVS